MTFQSDASDVYVPGQPVPKGGVRALFAKIDTVVQSGGKIFASRDEAVAYGNTDLVSAYRRIITIENSSFVVRGPGSTEDQLFDTSPHWGIIFRFDFTEINEKADVALQNGVLSLVNVGGTGSAITAEIPAHLQEQGMTTVGFDTVAVLIPAAENTGQTTLLVEGDAQRAVRTYDGQQLPTGYLQPGMPVVLQRQNANWRIITGNLDRTHLEAESDARKIADRNAGVVSLVNITGTPDALAADLDPAVELDSLSDQTVVILSIAEDNPDPTTLKVGDDATREITAYSGGSLDAGYLTQGRKYLLQRHNANWRVLTGTVDPADVDAAIAGSQAAILAQTENAITQTEGLGAVWPGDPNYLGPEEKPWFYFDGQGRLIANMSPLCKYTLAPDGVLLADGIGAPVVSIVEGRGRFSGDIYERAAPWPGDPLVVAYDGNGLPLVSIKPDGTYVFHAGIESPNIGGDAGGGGSGVEWLDAAEVDVSGNVWMAHKRGEDIHFFSEYRMRGERRTIAFVQRSFIRPDESTYTEQIAETPASALGVMAYGAGHVGHGTGLFEPYWPYIRLPDLSPAGSNSGASLRGFAALSVKDAEDAQLPLCIAITRVNPSTSLNDMQKGSADYAALMTSLGDAVNNAARWSKDLQIDRIAVSAGAPDLSLSKGAADAAYASLASDLRNDLVAATGQGFGPKILVSQSGGTDVSGSGGLILAEAELAIVHPLSGFVVAGPRYPYPLLAGSASQLSDEGIALCTELEAEAMRVTGLGQQWYCPSLASAVLNGTDIELAFSTLDNLEFDPDSDAPDYGFAVDGIDNGAVLTNIALQATPDLTNRVILTFDQAPTGNLIVRYAYGMSGEIGSGRFANRGALRDAWSKPSAILPGATLRRNALSAQMNVV